MFAPLNFSLEEYALAQALDYMFLMDDDMINESYVTAETSIPDTAEHKVVVEGDTVSVFVA